MVHSIASGSLSFLFTRLTCSGVFDVVSDVAIICDSDAYTEGSLVLNNLRLIFYPLIEKTDSNDNFSNTCITKNKYV